MSQPYDPVKDGLFTRFFVVVAGLGIVSALLFFANTSNLFSSLASVIVGTTASTTLSSLDDGLVGHWTFDGDAVSGTTVTDVSGNGNNGTMVNGPTKTIGRIGQGMSFDGNNDYISTTDIDYGTGNTISISAWIKFSSCTADGTICFIVSKGQYIGSSPYSLFVTDTQKIGFSVRENAGNVFYSSDTYNDDNWHHIGVSFDGSKAIIYVDGIKIGTSATYSPLNNNELVIIGGDDADPTNRPFAGSLDDVRVYARTLSADEVYRLYTLGKPNVINSKASQGDTLTEGLVGYWKLDETSGTTAADSSGNGNTGTLTNGPTWVTGKIGNGLDFDGSNDYVDASAGSSLKINGPQSMSFWMYGEGSSADAFMVGNGNASLQGFSCTHHNGATVYCYIQSGTNYVSASVGNNVWTHVTASWDGTTGTNSKKIYVNGVLISQGASTFGTLSGWTNFRMGEDATLNRTKFNGKLDEVRVYNRVLTAEEVARLYKDTTPTNPESGLVGHWTFDGPDIKGTTAYDRSGKGNNGTLTNGPTKAIGKLGQGLRFDGVDDRISYGNVSALKPSFPFTISAWVKGTGGTAFSNGKGEYFCSPATPYSDNYSGITFYMNGGVAGGNGSGQSASHRFERAAAVSAADGQWHHIVAVLQAGNNINLYKDGVLNNGSYDDGLATTIGYDTRPVLIGAQYGCSYIYPANGVVDDVRLYNRALSAEEIKNLYVKGSGAKVKICKEDSVQDADANTYYTMAIGSQCWLDRNMNVGTRINGAVAQTNNSTIEKWCYSDNATNCTTNHPNKPDGGLYQWDEAMQYSTSEGAQGICPNGFHIPTDAEWHTLEKFLTDGGGSCDPSRSGVASCSPAGAKLKADGLSKFEANLAGNYTSSFGFRDLYGYIMSSSENGSNIYIRAVGSSLDTLYRSQSAKTSGVSVRCIQD